MQADGPQADRGPRRETIRQRRFRLEGGDESSPREMGRRIMRNLDKIMIDNDFTAMPVSFEHARMAGLFRLQRPVRPHAGSAITRRSHAADHGRPPTDDLRHRDDLVTERPLRSRSLRRQTHTKRDSWRPPSRGQSAQSRDARDVAAIAMSANGHLEIAMSPNADMASLGVNGRRRWRGPVSTICDFGKARCRGSHISRRRPMPLAAGLDIRVASG